MPRGTFSTLLNTMYIVGSAIGTSASQSTCSAHVQRRHAGNLRFSGQLEAVLALSGFTLVVAAIFS